MFGISSLLSLALTTFAIAASSLDQTSSPSGNSPNYTIIENAATGSKLSFVTNSGICETTPGVTQYSGYFSDGEGRNMWFWFFSSRNNCSTAPLAMWLNGGPGCSSMIGLFQENGPCTFNNVSGPNPELNPYSWNNYANVLYVDQPAGTGLSYGNENTNSTPEAAPIVWKFLQEFYAHFSEYQNHGFALCAESYGGHYDPRFASYLWGTVSGIKIPMIALLINNAWIDPSVQFKALIDYGANNPYRVILNDSQAAALYKSYDDNCGPALQNCSISDSDDACSQAANVCIDTINGSFENIDFDSGDIIQGAYPEFPPVTYVSYLQDSDIQMRIGAQVPFQNCSITVFNNFIKSGDYARSFLSDLSLVVQSGIQVLLWVGDRDWICNTIGMQEVITEIQFDQSAEFNAAPLKPFTIGGVQYGTYKTMGQLSYLIMEQAGHQVPAFQPKASVEVFKQIIYKEGLHST